ncbi:MAG: NlpC/P60 family protein [Steroidobacteraceae bacterium]
MISMAEDTRARVIVAARSWIGTPFHTGARVKGAGVDCGHFLCAVFEEAGLVSKIELGSYPVDWHLHQADERYLQVLEQYMHVIAAPPQMGDVAMFRVGRAWSHGAIVLAWPRCIHAHVVGVEYTDASKEPLATKPVKFYSAF